MGFIALGISLFIFGICFLIAAPVLAAQYKRRTAETTGTITDVRTKRVRNRGTTYHFDLEYFIDGVRQELKSVSWPLSPDVTQTYTIRYNPKKPKDAHVKEFHSSNPKLYLIIGLVSVLISIVLVVAGAVS